MHPSLDDAFAWPCYPTEPGRGHRAHTQPAVPDPKPLSHLHRPDIRACPIRSNNHLQLFFCMKSLIRLDFCWFRFSPHPGFIMSMLWRLKGSPYDVQWCSVKWGRATALCETNGFATRRASK